MRRRAKPVAAARTQPAADATEKVFRSLAVHAGRYRDALGNADLSSYEYRVFSQSGEDGVIAEILRRVGTFTRWFVEFGIGTGHEGNCVLLADAYRWDGLFIEADGRAYQRLVAKYQHNPQVRTLPSLVTSGNVEQLFRDAGVPVEFGVLSIDIDGHDYWVWQAIESFRPVLVVVEYNATLDPGRALVWPPENTEPWDGTTYYGSSLGALRRVASTKGYRLVHTDMVGVNAFFVRDDVADAVGVADPPIRSLNVGLVGGQLAADANDRRWLDLDA